MIDDLGVALEYAAGHERLRLEAWGEDSIRVRASHAQIDRRAARRSGRDLSDPVSRRDR